MEPGDVNQGESKAPMQRLRGGAAWPEHQVLQTGVRQPEGWGVDFIPRAIEGMDRRNKKDSQLQCMHRAFCMQAPKETGASKLR